MPREYTKVFKQKEDIIERLAEGKTQWEVAQELGLKDIYVIKEISEKRTAKRSKTGGRYTAQDARTQSNGTLAGVSIREQAFENGERAVTGFSSRCWNEVRASVKYQVIHSKQEKYPLSVMCKFFNVSRSGYYDLIQRKDKPDKDALLAQLVTKCQARCSKTYGYRRVRLWLIREKSLYHNPKTVLRVMNKYGLLAEIRRYRKYRQMGQQLHRYENLLNREFTADKPN